MTLRIYTPTDTSEIGALFNLGSRKMKPDYELEGTSLFDRSDKVKLAGREIVLRELTMKYGAELQARYKLTFNPMSVLEVPENMNHGVKDNLIKRLVQEFGWVVTSEGLQAQEHFRGRNGELDLVLDKPLAGVRA